MSIVQPYVGSGSDVAGGVRGANGEGVRPVDEPGIGPRRAARRKTCAVEVALGVRRLVGRELKGRGVVVARVPCGLSVIATVGAAVSTVQVWLAWAGVAGRVSRLDDEGVRAVRKRRVALRRGARQEGFVVQLALERCLLIGAELEGRRGLVAQTGRLLRDRGGGCRAVHPYRGLCSAEKEPDRASKELARPRERVLRLRRRSGEGDGQRGARAQLVARARSRLPEVELRVREELAVRDPRRCLARPGSTRGRLHGRDVHDEAGRDPDSRAVRALGRGRVVRQDDGVRRRGRGLDVRRRGPGGERVHDVRRGPGGHEQTHRRNGGGQEMATVEHGSS